MIEREACSKADLPNWVIYLESVKVGSKATESPIDRRSINNPIRVGGRKSSILVVFLFCHLHQLPVRAVHAEDGVGRIMEGGTLCGGGGDFRFGS